MPISLLEQAQAVEAARTLVLGGPKPRRAEADEIANRLEEAGETLRRLAAAARNPWQAEALKDVVSA